MSLKPLRELATNTIRLDFYICLHHFFVMFIAVIKTRFSKRGFLTVPGHISWIGRNKWSLRTGETSARDDAAAAPAFLDPEASLYAAPRTSSRTDFVAENEKNAAFLFLDAVAFLTSVAFLDPVAFLYAAALRTGNSPCSRE